MSNRLFQSIVLQFKESTDRMVGVIDMEGNVIACTDLPSIGGHMPQVLPALNGERDATVTADGKTLKMSRGLEHPVWLRRLCPRRRPGGKTHLHHGCRCPQRGQELL